MLRVMILLWLIQISNSCYFIIFVVPMVQATQVEALAHSVEKACFEILGEKPVSVQGLRNGSGQFLTTLILSFTYSTRKQELDTDLKNFGETRKSEKLKQQKHE